MRRFSIPKVLAVTVFACGSPNLSRTDAGTRADAGQMAQLDAGQDEDAGPCGGSFFDCNCCGSADCRGGFECASVGRPEDAGVCACV